MSLADLPDFNYTETDVEVIQQDLINRYQILSQRTLAPGDPMIIAIKAWAYKFAIQDALINKVGKGQLLKYASGVLLDQLGAFYRVTRLPADFALTTIQFTLSAPLDTIKIIPAGTRIGVADGDGTLYFSTLEILTIPIGSLTGTVAAECNVAGQAGNGYLANQLTTLIDPISFVQSVTNTTTSSGGADTEDDESLRYRIYIAPESFSVAGPAGAYEYFAKSASSSILDVSVYSPAPVEVTVTVLLQNGVIPSQTLLNAVYEVLNDKTVRPLTDKVTVQAPDTVPYNVDGTYYISNSNLANSAAIQASVNTSLSEYVLWQKSKLGRDINPSELIARIQNAGALRVVINSPAFRELGAEEIAQEGTLNLSFGGFVDG